MIIVDLCSSCARCYKIQCCTGVGYWICEVTEEPVSGNVMFCKDYYEKPEGDDEE
jgi:hypothetical protein